MAALFGATFAGAIVGYDLWFYFIHRVLHVPAVYKRFHYQHHAFRHPTAREAFHASVTENVLSGLGILTPVLWLRPFSAGGLAAAWFICFVRGVLRHDARAAWLVGHHHLQHHLNPDCNFSAWYIDALLGTAYNK